MVAAAQSAFLDYSDSLSPSENGSRSYFPLIPGTRQGAGIWIKIADWQSEGGVVDKNSKMRGRITPEFQTAPFFEHVAVYG